MWREAIITKLKPTERTVHRAGGSYFQCDISENVESHKQVEYTLTK